MSKNEAYFMQNFAHEFGTCRDGDEQMQLQYREKQPHYGLTETQFFGFSIPEHDIHAFLYLWYHPNLEVVSGGPIVFQGKKSVQLAAELIDYRGYLPASQMNGDLTNYRLDNSYQVEMLEPARKFRLRYDDPARQNRYDLEYTAVSAPMMWPSSRHFEQVMKVEGELILRGARYDVGGFNIRDRSWGEARLEDPNPGPPACWMTCTFGEDFAFNVTAIDHPDRNPLWKDKFTVDPASVTKFGWMIVDGEPVVVERTVKHTTYNPLTLLPERIVMDVHDTSGRHFAITGTVQAALPLMTWHNARVPICLTRWECNGRVGYGDIQEAQWTDFIQAFHRYPG